jgi:hypothetical protein
MHRQLQNCLDTTCCLSLLPLLSLLLLLLQACDSCCSPCRHVHVGAAAAARQHWSQQHLPQLLLLLLLHPAAHGAHAARVLLPVALPVAPPLLCLQMPPTCHASL